MTMTRMYRHVLLPVVTLWLFLYVLVQVSPERWWGFRPGDVAFLSAESGQTPPLVFSREIVWPSLIAYRVTVRTISDQPDFEHGAGGQAPILQGDDRFINVACEDDSRPFTYRVGHGPLLDKDLAWWAPGDPRCGALKDGPYWVETIWTMVDPIGDVIRKSIFSDFPFQVLGPLTPKKTIVRNSGVFWIGRPPEGALAPAPL